MRLSISATLVFSASAVVAAEAAPGSGEGSSGTGDVFADLIVILRDVHGVPLLTPFTVEAEVGTTTEYCVQPVSYVALPGLGDEYRTVNEADGREVYRIPLLGETLELGAPGEDEVEVEACDPQPAYAMYVKEAELERLNMARQPDNVRTKKLDEVSIRLSTADEIGLDGTGRITTDGVAIDAAPDQAAIYASLMSTGTIPGLRSSPARVGAFDTWMLAAAAIGTATGKEVPLTVDAVEYYNRIVGVPAEHVPSADWTVSFRQTEPSSAESFVDYSGFGYVRSDVYRGCATWLDVPTLTWKVSTITDVIDFAALPPVARDSDGDAVPDTVDDVAGFTQLADDVRAAIVYIHENGVIPGFFMDPVGTNSCAAQQAALAHPAVDIAGLPATLIQTETVPASASVYMPWAGPTVSAAQLKLTVESTDPRSRSPTARSWPPWRPVTGPAKRCRSVSSRGLSSAGGALPRASRRARVQRDHDVRPDRGRGSADRWVLGQPRDGRPRRR